jgi:hypothetical protein
MIIYQYDSQGYFTGQTKEISDKEGCPKSWTRIQLPEIPENKLARFNGKIWAMDDTRIIIPPVIVLDILSTDMWSIPADGVTFATVTYTSDEIVYFVVESEIHAVEPVDQMAVLEITADAPGPIQVEVKDKQIVIAVEEVI